MLCKRVCGVLFFRENPTSFRENILAFEVFNFYLCNVTNNDLDMKKLVVYAACATLLFSSCDTYTGSGAYMGSSLGSILGSAIGGIADGPRGSDFGTIIGMAGGAAIGAAIGQAADQRRAAEKEEYQYDRAKRNYERKMRERQQNSDVSSYQEAPSTDSGYDETNSGDDRIYDFNGKDYQTDASTSTATTKMPTASGVENIAEGLVYTPNIEIRNARFLDENGNGIIERGELSKVIFEVMNRGDRPLYDVQPVVLVANGNRHLFVSPSIHIEKIEPGKGIRYTALVKADRRLKDGNAKICVSVLQGNKAISKVTEFNIPTKK